VKTQPGRGALRGGLRRPSPAWDRSRRRGRPNRAPVIPDLRGSSITRPKTRSTRSVMRSSARSQGSYTATPTVGLLKIISAAPCIVASRSSENGGAWQEERGTVGRGGLPRQFITSPYGPPIWEVNPDRRIR